MSIDDTDIRTAYEGSCQAHEEVGPMLRAVLDRIADKWSLLVIATLQHGLLRFGQLREHIPGVSQRMLTLTLRNLERDGLVTRTVFAEVPPRVEYELTDIGRTLIGPSIALAEWAIAHHGEIEASRVAYDARDAG
jgi:DNA-binding HxlR family transcriptional regulator